jgi:histidinol-phosphate/aromatic aminotransferase/cobyric acid decarboxylase-like protein
MTPRPNPHVTRLAPYEWEAMASDVAAAAGIDESDVVRFDTNTTPWPPVAWEQTVLDTPRLPANEYPHPSNEPLRTKPCSCWPASIWVPIATRWCPTRAFRCSAS